jgi:hypothetical protein
MHPPPRQLLVGFSGLNAGGPRDRAVSRWDYELSARTTGGRTTYAKVAQDERPQIPLLRYSVVVGLALIGLLYAVNAMLPDNTPHHLNNNTDGIASNNLESNRPARQQQHTAAVIAPAPAPDMTSSAAVPAAAPPTGAKQASQKFNAPSARVASNPPPNNKRNRSARKRVWKSDFRRDRGWRDRGWHDPYWGNWHWR